VITRRTILAAAPAILTGKSRRANLLFLCSDQHQRAASGCYGHTEVQTPNIDAIAAKGVRFDRAYCQAPVCVPARGSIVTGVYPHAHGAKILQDPLPADARTIAHFYKERGYQTGAIGKMHFVDETRKHGFDYRLHSADFNATLTKEERDGVRKDQGGAAGYQGRPSKLDARYFRDNWYAEKTVEFLHAHKDKPFCLWSSYFMPHTPLVPARKYWDLYDPKKLALPERTNTELEGGFHGNLIRAKERGWYGQSDEGLGRSLAGYYGNVSQMDACIGRVYDTLRELGLDKNTVVVYTSDHGEMAGAHRMWTKHNMYEESVGVPLIVSLPDRAEAGAARPDLVEQVDLFPTLAELCGLEAPDGIHGRSFGAAMRGDSYARREVAYSEYYFCRNVFTKDNRFVGKPPMLMVRSDKWKLNYISWAENELYDVVADPGEHHNLIDASGNAGVVKELTATAEGLWRL
jgi:choline-sulfatase